MNIRSDHRKSYVWLVRGDGRGVIGYKLEELNKLIDEWNNLRYQPNDFWEWLSWMEGDYITGFDVLWNRGNPLWSQVHSIKRKHKEV